VRLKVVLAILLGAVLIGGVTGLALWLTHPEQHGGYSPF
jgi:hypothetical protein